MCIIIAKPAGVEPLDEGYFERAWAHNSHGGGVAWKAPENEDVHVQKGFMKKDVFLAKLKEINKKENSFIAHFRIKSVGDVNPENTHPFVMEKVVFAHNGTIHNIVPLEGKTDSETFGLAFLKNRSMRWIKENQTLLELALGASKFAIMDNKTGEILILNKQNGKEQDGAWFSNSSADKPAQVPQQNYAGFRGLDDYDYTDYSENFKRRVPARQIFGTKSFTENFCEYTKEKGYWTYTTSGRPATTYPFTSDLVINRNGLWKINPNLEPSGFGFEKHEYKHKAPEFKIVAIMQRELQQNLSEYWKKVFSSESERNDFEQDVNALNIVVDAARRFIRNGVELNYDNLNTFVLSCMTFSKYAGKWQTEDAQDTIFYASEYINQMFGLRQ